jgi:hypothetical protein
MGAFWGTLFQVAVAPMQWAMAKGHTIGKTITYQMTTEAARLEMEDSEAQKLTIERNVQAARGSLTTVDMNVDEENNNGGQPKH